MVVILSNERRPYIPAKNRFLALLSFALDTGNPKGIRAADEALRISLEDEKAQAPDWNHYQKARDFFLQNDDPFKSYRHIELPVQEQVAEKFLNVVSHPQFSAKRQLQRRRGEYLAFANLVQKARNHIEAEERAVRNRKGKH